MPDVGNDNVVKECVIDSPSFSLGLQKIGSQESQGLSHHLMRVLQYPEGFSYIFYKLVS